MTSVDRLWPAELRLLLGRDAADLLSSVAESAGGRLVAHAPRQVNHQPGSSTTVQYRAQVEWPDASLTQETFVAMTGRRAPKGTAVFERGDTRVAVWRWPRDPALPGLDAVLDVQAVAGLLADLGIRRRTDLPPTLITRAYRPGRRAVVQAVQGDHSLYLKVVRPSTVSALHDTHHRLARILPAPDSLGWSDDGILVLPGLRGETLRSILRHDGGSTPSPAQISELLDRLPGDLLDRPRRPGPVESAVHHARTLAAVAPQLQERLDRLVDQIRTNHDAHPVEHDTVPTHGDLYEAQLLIDDGRITGLLDLDTAGPGHRVDDLANFCAHLSVLALTTGTPGPINRYGAALLAHAEETLERPDVRTRIAAFVVGLATGPFRVLEPDWLRSTERRLDLASTWMESAHQAGRREISAASR